MERTYISANLQNLITIPVMAAGGFLLASVIYQVLLAVFGSDEGSALSPAPSNNTGDF